MRGRSFAALRKTVWVDDATHMRGSIRRDEVRLVRGRAGARPSHSRLCGLHALRGSVVKRSKKLRRARGESRPAPA